MIKDFRKERKNIAGIVVKAFEKGFSELDGRADNERILGYAITDYDKVMDVYRATGDRVLGRKLKIHEVEKGYNSVLEILNDKRAMIEQGHSAE